MAKTRHSGRMFGRKTAETRPSSHLDANSVASGRISHRGLHDCTATEFLKIRTAPSYSCCAVVPQLLNSSNKNSASLLVGYKAPAVADKKD
jgi:hypothetical protein